MSYFDIDNLFGKPVEIYKFSSGNQFWYYTSSSKDKTISNNVYKSIPIKRSSKKTSKEISNNNMSIEITNNAFLLDEFKSRAPSTDVFVEIREYYENDTDLESIILWSGRISSVEFNGEKTASIKCISSAFISKTQMNKRNFQTGCSHVLYGNRCKALRNLFLIQANIISINSNTITVSSSSIDNDSLSGGYAEFNNSEGTQARFITSNTGNVLTIDREFNGIIGGDQLDLYPGCKHNVDDCNNKFNNIINYGGQPYYANKNPIGGDNVF